MSAILLYCRPGFEKECLAEVTHEASEKGAFGWSNLEMNSGFVIFETEQADAVYQLANDLVFTRDAWPIYQKLDNLNPKDRLSPIVSAVNTVLKDGKINRLGQISCEFAEGDDYRATSKFAGKFTHPLRQALRSDGVLTKKDDPTKPMLRLFFKDSTQVLVGVDSPSLRAPWTMGIARLKSPASAPSRSTLKLEQAFGHFLGTDWRTQLEDCHTGVDLGASPGGWTWQLVNQQMNVYAIDNGPMDKQLMATGLVDHLEEDGFVWTPKNTVDWLVCDMVEKPMRVAKLMYEWLDQRHARYAIFNLKLPMKKRFHEWLDIKEYLDIQISQNHPKAILKAKHLYYDREEITVFMDLRNQNG
jgi:23S rRNA (cytidine2498-2'-O)-methyltransferase